MDHKKICIRRSFSWADVEPEEHAVAFAVAKAMKVDVLQTIQGALQKALDEGIPYKQFAKDLEPRLRDLGWSGEKKRVDVKTGKARIVRLGSPRRLKTIYRANIRSARAAGQWDRIQRTKRALPYLVYQLGPSERHRIDHQAKEGLVLPVDHPFWQQWYPPNGPALKRLVITKAICVFRAISKQVRTVLLGNQSFRAYFKLITGCKCHVRQITKREAERRGISNNPDVPMKRVLNHRTGEIKNHPQRYRFGVGDQPRAGATTGDGAVAGRKAGRR